MYKTFLYYDTLSPTPPFFPKSILVAYLFLSSVKMNLKT